MTEAEQLRERADRLRKVLLEDYGIHNEKELLEAIRKQKPLNIGIFVSPVPSRGKEVVRGA